jgi:hypothetical protein
VTPAAIRANDIVVFRASRWRVVLVTTGLPGKPTRLRLMRVVNVDAREVTPTGENIGTGGRS